MCAAFHICYGEASQLHATLFTALDFSKKKYYTPAEGNYSYCVIAFYF